MKKKKPTISDSDIASLKDGLKSPFWKTLKKCIEIEVDELERKIWNSEHGKLTSDVVRDLINERNTMALFLEYPERYIEEAEPKKVVDGSEELKKDKNDPYDDIDRAD
jgi:Mor family transcriptional regulator